MKLNCLLKNVEHKKNSTLNPDIKFLTCNSKEVKKNSLFVCLNGVNFNGHNFANAAIKAGAVAVLVEKNLNLKNQIIVKDTHKAFAKICANFYSNPAKKLKFIGVTGTNGKTSISKIIKEILTNANKKVGLIGTIQNEIGNIVQYAQNTTPNHLEFQKILKNMVDYGCEYVVLEVSSHALVQQRIAGTKFEIAIFTNLTQDHLDYHKTMENYFNAKKMLFKMCENAIVCADNKYGLELLKELKCKSYSFGIENKDANFLATNVKIDENGVEYFLKGEQIEEKISFKTPGVFSIYNTMAAFISCFLLKIETNIIKNTLKNLQPIKGRSEKIPTHTNFTIICDYAHSPDGLKNILTAINSYKKAKLITLFGCGGDRDKTKRPKMGEVAAKNSDFLIVTSDNPRTENPKKIIEDILVGVKKTTTPYVKIVNRKDAIFYAVKKAKKNDIILLAGKGHETYQVIGKSKINLDEREIVKKALEKLKEEN